MTRFSCLSSASSIRLIVSLTSALLLTWKNQVKPAQFQYDADWYRAHPFNASSPNPYDITVTYQEGSMYGQWWYQTLTHSTVTRTVDGLATGFDYAVKVGALNPAFQAIGLIPYMSAVPFCVVGVLPLIFTTIPSLYVWRIEQQRDDWYNTVKSYAAHTKNKCYHLRDEDIIKVIKEAMQQSHSTLPFIMIEPAASVVITGLGIASVITSENMRQEKLKSRLDMIIVQSDIEEALPEPKPEPLAPLATRAAFVETEVQRGILEPRVLPHPQLSPDRLSGHAGTGEAFTPARPEFKPFLTDQVVVDSLKAVVSQDKGKFAAINGLAKTLIPLTEESSSNGVITSIKSAVQAAFGLFRYGPYSDMLTEKFAIQQDAQRHMISEMVKTCGSPGLLENNFHCSALQENATIEARVAEILSNRCTEIHCNLTESGHCASPFAQEL